MKFKNRVSRIVLLSVTAILLMSCGNNSEVKEEGQEPSSQENTVELSTQPEESDEKETETTTEPIQSENEVIMSDELFDFTFELEGVLYQLPCSLDKFIDNGWVITSRGYSAEAKLSANSYDFFNAKKDGKDVYIYLYNLSGNAKKLSECKVGGIQCELSEGASIKIAKGITPLSTKEEIEAAFGIPNKTSYEKENCILEYSLEDSNKNYAELCVSSGENQESYIELRNFILTPDDITETNEEAPKYLSEYIKPTSIGTDIFSAKFSLEGDVYQLPAPLTAFLDNGWKIVSAPSKIVSGDWEIIYIEKNGKKLAASIKNLADYQTIVSNCIVYSISVSIDNDVDIILPVNGKEIKIGLQIPDVDFLLNNNFNYNEGVISNSYSYYEYEKRDFSVSILLNKETGVVEMITLKCNTWNYTN